MTNEITNTMKLLTNYNVKKTLTENYSNLFNDDKYVFDFVLSENNKYLIVMDQLFIAGGDGKSVGSIWENTYIFNEILTENLEKLNIISESTKNEISNQLNNIQWTKEIILECITTKNTLFEEEEGLWSKFKKGVSNLGSKISAAAMPIVKTLFNKGVLPFLRWVRRMTYTNIGIVIDVVVSILAMKANAAVWGLIVLLDIYEIATGDYDPKDPTRKDMPYILLIGDLMGFLFSGAISAMWKGLVNPIKTQGVRKAAPKLVPYLEKMAEKIPSLKNSLSSIIDALTKKFGSTGILSTIVRSIDKVLGGLLDFFKKLLSKEGLKSSATGGVVLGAVKGIEHQMGKMSKEKSEKFASAMTNAEKKLQGTFGKAEVKVDPAIMKNKEDKLRELGLII
jgi:hypothetical protein